MTGALALPASGLADDTGGAPAPDGPSPTLTAAPGAIVNRVLTLSGNAAQAGATVTIQRLDPQQGWADVANTQSGPDGAFSAAWRPDHLGHVSLRAVVGDPAAAARSAGTSPSADVTVYRPATATWYGPGFYGKKTACGIRMTHALVGVAHRSLPCGTQVQVYYQGRSLTVPVVDRGPFARGVSWDLTTATAQQLGVTTTSRIGAVALRDQPPAAPPAR